MSEGELAQMIRTLRVVDLKSLLTYARSNKSGNKETLQTKVLNLIQHKSPVIEQKIRQLFFKLNQSRVYSRGREMYPMPPMRKNVMSYGNRPNYGLTTSSAHHNVLPQYPDVKFKELPFYDVLAELLKPTSLITLPNNRFQQQKFAFCLTLLQVLEFQSNDVQVQLRICLLDSSCEQVDEIPPSICLEVNQVVANLPNPIPNNKLNQELKRPKEPINISSLIKKTATEPNEVQISWASRSGKPYVLGIFLVRRQNSTMLMRRMMGKGVIHRNHTTNMIKKILSQDKYSGITTMILRASLMCPLGKIKMKLPCRAVTCTHLQCFDAMLYLQMEEKKPKWDCPVCGKPLLFKDLVIDGLFINIILESPAECTEVQFHEDGSWSVMSIKKLIKMTDASMKTPPKDVPKIQVAKPKRPIEIITISDSDTEDSVISPKKIQHSEEKI
ncbi:hypothetical protein TNCV_2599321 [Trichonephila clavipes]|uniref:Uncharacterized protein n=1 Tax=Trichonephila clavipes TaxID=2585209 RepID=A0A8X6UXI4_TRICX|nr:hypothetical protein TNCV_2599321 [Trichonephila clavipes]